VLSLLAGRHLGWGVFWPGCEAVGSYNRSTGHELPAPSSVAQEVYASCVYREEKLPAEMHGLLSESRTNFHPHGWLQNHVGGLVVNQERKRWMGSEPAQTYGPPSRLPGRIGSGCLSKAVCWQVFGLASTSACAAFLLSTASRLRRTSACRGIVLADRCGAAPDSHRVPFLFSE